jgi:hypothetical protein
MTQQWTSLIFLGTLLLSPSKPVFPAETPLKIINVAVPAVSLLQSPLFVAIDAGAFNGQRLTGDTPIRLPQLLPSEYFHRQIWISFVDDPLGVKMVGSVLDGDKVMFGSDYPHPASTWPFSQQVIEEQMQDLSPDVRKKIIRDNARVLCGI